MNTPDYLNQAGDLVASVYSQIESELLNYLVGKMIDGDITGQRSLTALYAIAQSAGPALQHLINVHEGEIDAAVKKEISDALRKSDKDDLRRIKRGMGVDLPGIDNRTIAATVAGVEQILARENLMMADYAKESFVKWSSWAITQVNTGNMTTEKALHKAVRELEKQGISTVTYRNAKTGVQTVTNRVDVAVRRHIRTQILQDGQRLTETRLDQAGVEFVEVSSHTGARPSHAKWQGRVYSRHGDRRVDGVLYRDFKTACNWGDVADGIGGANCRHSYAAWFPGMPRTYEPNPQHPSGESNERIYELTQEQRHLERQIRETKRELAGAEQLYGRSKAVYDLGEVSRLKMKLQKQQAAMRELIAKNDKVLQRSPRREWAGDMPKVKIPTTSGRRLDEFLESAAVKGSGLSKAKIRKAMVKELEDLGYETGDFSALTRAEQQNIWKRVRDQLRAATKPTAKKAREAKQAARPKFTFTPAKTIKEAEEYARNVIGCNSSFKGLSVEAANDLNEAVARHVHDYPELKDNFGFIGSIQECNKKRKELWAEYYYQRNKPAWSATGNMTEQAMRARAKRLASKTIGNTSSNVWAWSYSPKPDAPDYAFRGVCMNQKFFKNSEIYQATVKSTVRNVEKKWHPEGTGNIKSIFDHEVGHQLDALLGISKDREFLRYTSGMTDNDVFNGLSEYATTNDKEFVAEAWSEYLNNPNPREMARTIGDMIERRYNELNKRK